MDTRQTELLKEFMQQYCMPDLEAAAMWAQFVGTKVFARESGLPESLAEELIQEHIPKGSECVSSPININFGIRLEDEPTSNLKDEDTGTRLPVSNLELDLDSELPDSHMIYHIPIDESTDQGNIGSCVAWAGAHSAEITVNRAENSYSWRGNPSACYGFIKENCLDPWPNEHGSTLTALEKALRKFGIPEWDSMPIHKDAPKGNPANLPLPKGINKKARKNRVAESFWIDEWTEDSIKSAQCLMSGHYQRTPVRGLSICTAFKVPASLFNQYTAKTGIILLPPKGDPIRGGHAVAFVGWKIIEGKLYFIIKNSWGPEFGDAGYLYAPVAFIKEYFKSSFVCHNLLRERDQIKVSSDTTSPHAVLGALVAAIAIFLGIVGLTSVVSKVVSHKEVTPQQLSAVVPGKDDSSKQITSEPLYCKTDKEPADLLAEALRIYARIVSGSTEGEGEQQATEQGPSDVSREN